MQYANSEVFSVSEPDHCNYTIKITEKDNPEIEMFPTVTFMDHEEFNKKIVIAGTTNADYPDSEEALANRPRHYIDYQLEVWAADSSRVTVDTANVQKREFRVNYQLDCSQIALTKAKVDQVSHEIYWSQDGQIGDGELYLSKITV